MIPLRPKKHFGQNFLVDQRVVQKIIESCDLKPDDVVVEIGPGQGALTRLVAPRIKHLICVETDLDLIAPLRSVLPVPVEIVHADFLRWDFPDLPLGVKVIGNIPYNISTPIIEKLIDNRTRISSAFLTVQLEFGGRLTAGPGGKDYGSLSCFAQYYAETQLLFKIKNSSFKPVPKVDSCFLRMDMRDRKLKPVEDEGFLFQLIQTAFKQRRKTIVNALKGLVGKEPLEKALDNLKVSPMARPETLSLSNYIGLCRALVI